MPVDREAVEAFVAAIRDETIEFLHANSERFIRMENLIERFDATVSTWRKTPEANVRSIVECANEICIARKLLEWERCLRITYEPPLQGTNRTIDFLIETENDCILLDVKTVHPEARDAFERFQRIVDAGLLSDNTEIVISRRWLGGEIAHSMLASRQKFLDHTLDLEEKIEAIQNKSDFKFAIIFCSNAYDWHIDELEDFSDFYTIGRHRQDDPFGKMELHFLAESGVALRHTIGSFWFMERRESNVTPAQFLCNVRGPTFGR